MADWLLLALPANVKLSIVVELFFHNTDIDPSN